MAWTAFLSISPRPRAPWCSDRRRRACRRLAAGLSTICLPRLRLPSSSWPWPGRTPGTSPGTGGRRTTVVCLDPLDDVAMARLVDGLVAGLPDASVKLSWHVPTGSRSMRWRPSAPDRPGPGHPPRGTVRPRRHLHPRPGCDRRPGVVAGPGRGPADSLTPEEKALVTDASVLGASFTVDGLVALAPPRIWSRAFWTRYGARRS